MTGNWIRCIAREKIFGPVLSLLAFDDEEEVIAQANDTSIYRAGAVFNEDIRRAHRVARQLGVGRCWINCYNLAPVEVPIGGVKDSGIDRECVMASLDHFTQIKNVIVEAGDIYSVF